MRLLTENEIQFLKDTGVTPTVIQGDEWERTIFADEIGENPINGDEVFTHACVYAKQMYDVNLPELYEKCTLDIDGLSLEEEAPYVIYCLLTEEELDSKTDEELLKWLKDWKYFVGYRKWSEWDTRIARHEAKGLFNGAREVRTYDDGGIYISHRED